jgi:hypothetical protein
MWKIRVDPDLVNIEGCVVNPRQRQAIRDDWVSKLLVRIHDRSAKFGRKPPWSRYTSLSFDPSWRSTSGFIAPLQPFRERSAAHFISRPSDSPHLQHRLEYRSLAVIRNAHTA